MTSPLSLSHYEDKFLVESVKLLIFYLWDFFINNAIKITFMIIRDNPEKTVLFLQYRIVSVKVSFLYSTFKKQNKTMEITKVIMQKIKRQLK